MDQCFNILDRLANSKFRSRFKLRVKELEYIKDKGFDTIYIHACYFIWDRVAPVGPINDDKQTPMHGTPCFHCPTRNRNLLPWLYWKMALISKRQRTNCFRTRISCFSNYGMDKQTNYFKLHSITLQNISKSMFVIL